MLLCAAEAHVGKFIVRNGELEGRKFRLEPGASITIGRELGDLNFPDKRMSRRHCLLEAREDGDYIKDLGSTNGTWVNNQRVKEALLRPGDLIRLGFTEFEFLGTPESQPARTQPAPATDALAASPNQTIAFRRSDLGLAAPPAAAAAPAQPAEAAETRAERRHFRQKSRIQAAKYAAMGKSKQLISAKGKFCEACGEAIFMKEGAPDEGTIRNGLYLCKMCALIAEKQRATGADYLPSYAKIVGGRMPSVAAQPTPEATGPAPEIVEAEEVDLSQITGEQPPAPQPGTKTEEAPNLGAEADKGPSQSTAAAETGAPEMGPQKVETASPSAEAEKPSPELAPTAKEKDAEEKGSEQTQQD